MWRVVRVQCGLPARAVCVCPPLCGGPWARGRCGQVPPRWMGVAPTSPAAATMSTAPTPRPSAPPAAAPGGSGVVDGSQPPSHTANAHVSDTNTDADVAAARPPQLSAATKWAVWASLLGNGVIAALKGIVWFRTGSPSMLAEAMHTVVDALNQAVLALGVSQSSGVNAVGADAKHPYGRGKSAFILSLVAAVGMFWVGGGVSIGNGVYTLWTGNPDMHIGWENWAVLAASLAVDGTVLSITWRELSARAREQFPALYTTSRLRAVVHHMRHSSDPFLTAVALEDVVACAGVLMAGVGTGAAQWFGYHSLDSFSSIAIGGLLSTAAVFLIRLNHDFLLGRSVDAATAAGVAAVIRAFPTIDTVQSVTTQWVSPTTFAVSARVDFDGTALAARLHDSYEDMFKRSANLADDLPVLLSFYAEDVTRLVESEVTALEAAIKQAYPAAVVIELEPSSADSGRFMSRTTREVWARKSREEADRLFEEHLDLLHRQQAERPGEAAALKEQETRIRQWFQRRVAGDGGKGTLTG